MFNDWFVLLKKLSKNNYSTKDIICPECGQKNIECIFVGNSTTHIGYLPIWCRSCNKGIQISRVEIPKKVNMIEFGDLEAIKNMIPSFEHIVPK
ncbi:hypothetical protein D7X87_23945 [bacterium D16-54]|nr:hypothetical protein D7X87_23945 [bacterium D16-54]RKJ09960.1 hypothetical protein D7X65_24395 [bacterium D16-56]